MRWVARYRCSRCARGSRRHRPGQGVSARGTSARAGCVGAVDRSSHGAERCLTTSRPNPLSRRGRRRASRSRFRFPTAMSSSGIFGRSPRRSSRQGRLTTTARPSSSSNIARLKAQVIEWVKPEAIIYTDEWPAYTGLDAYFAAHSRVRHSNRDTSSASGTRTPSRASSGTSRPASGAALGRAATQAPLP